MQPYRRKPKLNAVFIPLEDPLRSRYNYVSLRDVISWMKYLLWMADISLDSSKSTPFWAGWNARLIPQDDMKQKVLHLPQINDYPKFCGSGNS